MHSGQSQLSSSARTRPEMTFGRSVSQFPAIGRAELLDVVLEATVALLGEVGVEAIGLIEIERETSPRLPAGRTLRGAGERRATCRARWDRDRRAAGPAGLALVDYRGSVCRQRTFRIRVVAGAREPGDAKSSLTPSITWVNVSFSSRTSGRYGCDDEMSSRYWSRTPL